MTQKREIRKVRTIWKEREVPSVQMGAKRIDGRLKGRMDNWLNQYEDSYKQLMAYYRCAIMEMATKFNVLSEELSLKFDRNPIESIKTRLKSPESIMEKLARKDFPLSIESIQRNLTDVAGIRVICSFPSDIYRLADTLLSQDDVVLIEKKDYIKDPKPNGYRSLHLIVSVPIFLHDHKKHMTVEVQFRTIAMDWWASLEHKIMYKKDIPQTDEFKESLLRCAQRGYYLDMEMENIYYMAVDYSEHEKPLFNENRGNDEE